MRVLRKLCAFVYLLATIVVVGGMVALRFGTARIQERLGSLLDRPAGSIALGVCLAIVALGVLITVIRLFAERRELTSVHPAGNPNLEVRISALSSVARTAAEELDVLVDRVRSRVTGRDGSQVLVTLELIAFTEVGLADLGARVQAHVTEACERMLGAPGVTVRIRFLPSKTTVIKEDRREQA
ncbi:alkaline shock response membrane anchor protein AmaP [Enorma burkinafasonensis]|uniref:alkaline shock response membrane anchor protein AmaP n=1 Tax=Enorma burkinafasonensis TaxID=2590867 RepID=UPI0026F01059|nr:alkaline shock response membrane anchor protein AmaP [Enorma burkinafasonensis]MCI7730957.1 alkaline shock response membrane anchor protein AmaP [Enorma burkinafasonensis]